MKKKSGELKVIAKGDVCVSEESFKKYKKLLDSIHGKDTVYHIIKNLA